MRKTERIKFQSRNIPKLTSAAKVKVRCFAAFAHRFDITFLLE